jgi:sigma54-dependent transcription regulator
MKVCLFLLAARRYLPAKLVDTIPPEEDKNKVHPSKAYFA